MDKRQTTDEACAGCGILAEQHPIAAVMSDDGGQTFYQAPVCVACHTDPAHRRLPLKASFFTRADAANAVRLAGERDQHGNPQRS